MNKDVEFLIDVVKKANLLITEEFEVKAKGNNGDVVTNFDFEVEEYIIKRIKEEYPGFSIVSEEYNSENKMSDNCFTIDPIDGTINFSNGNILWGIQVACVKNGKTCAAVIYLPKLNELYYADETGAYMNNKKISVNNTTSIDKGLYAVEGTNKLASQINMKKINRHCRDYYSSAVTFSWVAKGDLRGVLFTKESYWDFVPGEYIVKQAGGVTYNAHNIHIAANNIEFLELLKEQAYID